MRGVWQGTFSVGGGVSGIPIHYTYVDQDGYSHLIYSAREERKPRCSVRVVFPPGGGTRVARRHQPSEIRRLQGVQPRAVSMRPRLAGGKPGCSKRPTAPASLSGDDEDFPCSDEDEELALAPTSLPPAVHRSPAFDNHERMRRSSPYDDRHKRHRVWTPPSSTYARPTYTDPSHQHSPLAKAFGTMWDAPRTPVPSTPREGRFCLPRVPTPRSPSRASARPSARDVSSHIPSLPVSIELTSGHRHPRPGKLPHVYAHPPLVLSQALVRPVPVKTRARQQAAPPSLTNLSALPRTDRCVLPTPVTPAAPLLSPPSMRAQVFFAADVLSRDTEGLVIGTAAAVTSR